jgi:hypothetical protein
LKAKGKAIGTLKKKECINFIIFVLIPPPEHRKNGKRQTANGKRQTANGKRQTANGQG